MVPVIKTNIFSVCCSLGMFYVYCVRLYVCHFHLVSIATSQVGRSINLLEQHGRSSEVITLYCGRLGAQKLVPNVCDLGIWNNCYIVSF